VTTLSICIATRNRGAFIGATLQTIVSQMPDGVEIVVVDGNSTDDTEDVLTEWAKRVPAFRYHRLATNGGVDCDYAAAVELSTGRYFWLFTDDDLLAPGTVDAVLQVIQNNPALVLVNAEVWDQVFEHRCDPNRLRIRSDRVYERGEDDRLLADVGRYLTFIGGVVLRRDVWNSRNKEAYFGSLFIHFGVIFQAPLPGHTAVIAAPRIRIRYGNAMWTARTFEIWMFKWPALVWSMPRADWAKKAVTPAEPWRNPSALLIHRAAGSYGMEQYRSFLAVQRPLPLRLLARLVALMPFRLLNRTALLALMLLGFGHRTTAIDIRNAGSRK
jgi:abequosyltransferase